MDQVAVKIRENPSIHGWSMICLVILRDVTFDFGMLLAADIFGMLPLDFFYMDEEITYES